MTSGEIADAHAFNGDAVREQPQKWVAELERDYHYPSIIIWSAINESWASPI